jgi:hypothetical protein
LQITQAGRIDVYMTKNKKSKAAMGAAATIGSAAIAAALLYAGKRFRKKPSEPPKTIPSGEPPETD